MPDVSADAPANRVTPLHVAGSPSQSSRGHVDRASSSLQIHRRAGDGRLWTRRRLLIRPLSAPDARSGDGILRCSSWAVPEWPAGAGWWVTALGLRVGTT